MGIAVTVAQYLNDHEIPFDVVKHPNTMTAADSAEASHISGDRLAKAVVLKGRDGFVVGVRPASHRIELGKLRKLLAREVDLANEEEIESLFTDCEPGAVPALGEAYGLKTIVDDSLSVEDDVYFEGGDHASLVHVSGAHFRRLMAAARHGYFTDHLAG